MVTGEAAAGLSLSPIDDPTADQLIANATVRAAAALVPPNLPRPTIRMACRHAVRPAGLCREIYIDPVGGVLRPRRHAGASGWTGRLASGPRRATTTTATPVLHRVERSVFTCRFRSFRVTTTY